MILDNNPSCQSKWSINQNHNHAENKEWHQTPINGKKQHIQKKCSSIQSFTQMKYIYFGFFEFFLQGKSQVYQKQNEQVQIHEIRLFHEIPIKASTCIKPNSFLVFHMYLPLETILIKT